MHYPKVYRFPLFHDMAEREEVTFLRIAHNNLAIGMIGSIE
jgi:hypothetical protein